MGYFATGWTVALYLPRLREWSSRHAGAAGVLCAAAFGLWIAANAKLLPLWYQGLYVIVYTFGVVGALTLLTLNRPIHPVVRFLSESSLTIYLYHRILILLALPHTEAWHPLLRIFGLLLLGLASTTLLVLLGRRLLGRRWSRILLGS